MPTLRRCSPCVIVCDVTVIVYCTRLKCQLSGDALHDSGSLLNSIKSNPECFVLLIQTPYPLQLVPVTRIALWRNGQGFLYGGSINFGWDGGFYQDNATGIQTLSGVFEQNSDWTMTTPVNGSGIELRGRQVRSDGSDRTFPRCQTRVSVTPKITGRSGLMKFGLNRTYINRQAHS